MGRRRIQKGQSTEVGRKGMSRSASAWKVSEVLLGRWVARHCRSVQGMRETCNKGLKHCQSGFIITFASPFGPCGSFVLWIPRTFLTMQLPLQDRLAVHTALALLSSRLLPAHNSPNGIYKDNPLPRETDPKHWRTLEDNGTGGMLNYPNRFIINGKIKIILVKTKLFQRSNPLFFYDKQAKQCVTAPNTTQCVCL